MDTAYLMVPGESSRSLSIPELLDGRSRGTCCVVPGVSLCSRNCADRQQLLQCFQDVGFDVRKLFTVDLSYRVGDLLTGQPTIAQPPNGSRALVQP